MGSSAVEGLFGSFSHYLYKFDRPAYQGHIGKFRQKVHSYGVAHNHLFLVQIPYVNQTLGSGFTSIQHETLSFFCHAASIPALNVMTSSYRENEAHYEVPYGISYEPVTLNFYGDKNMVMKSLFDKWYTSITNSRAMQDFYVGHNRLSFMDDYTSDVQIIMLDKSTAEVYKATLKRAWPKSIGGVDLHAQNSEVVSFPVQFSYERLELERLGAPNELEGSMDSRPKKPLNFPMNIVSQVGAVASEFIETATGYSPTAIQVSLNNASSNVNTLVTGVRDRVDTLSGDADNLFNKLF